MRNFGSLFFLLLNVGLSKTVMQIQKVQLIDYDEERRKFRLNSNRTG